MLYDGGLTCGRDDVVCCLAAKSGEQAGLPRTRQTDTNHVIFWSGRGRSFTAKRPETLKTGQRRGKGRNESKKSYNNLDTNVPLMFVFMRFLRLAILRE